MHKKTLHPMYEAEIGGAGGAPAPEGMKDPAGDDKAVKAAGAMAVVHPGKTTCQVVIGPKVQFVYDAMKELL